MSRADGDYEYICRTGVYRGSSHGPSRLGSLSILPCFLQQDVTSSSSTVLSETSVFLLGHVVTTKITSHRHGLSYHRVQLKGGMPDGISERIDSNRDGCGSKLRYERDVASADTTSELRRTLGMHTILRLMTIPLWVQQYSDTWQQCLLCCLAPHYHQITRLISSYILTSTPANRQTCC